MRTIRILGSVLALTAIVPARGSASTARASAATGCPLPAFVPGAQYHPEIRPSDFSADVTNQWFPLTPGVTNVYSGVKDDRPAVNVFQPTAHTKIIAGVRTRVVQDRLFLDGKLHERTADYYAQDRCGNVWYFGEDTATLNDDGTVASTDGTWRHGRAGARAGVFMQAAPERGRRFRQEWLAGHAEDTYRAIDLDAHATVPFGRFDHALRTEETTALEPDVVDNKLYVRGVGEVSEVAVRGGAEHLELVDVIR